MAPPPARDRQALIDTYPESRNAVAYHPDAPAANEQVEQAIDSVEGVLRDGF